MLQKHLVKASLTVILIYDIKANQLNQTVKQMIVTDHITQFF